MNAEDEQDQNPIDTELLDELTAALAPPPRIPPPDRIAALRAEFAANQATPISRPQPAPRSLWWQLTAAAAAVLIALTAGFLVGQRGDDDGSLAGGVIEFEETLTANDGRARADVTGVLTGIGRVVMIRTDELPILPKGEYYEVWFVGPDDTPDRPNRISAGTFHPDEEGVTEVDLAAAVNPALFPVLSVTAEPGDGDPRPTGPEVLRTAITILD